MNDTRGLDPQLADILARYSGRAAATIRSDEHLSFDLGIDADDFAFDMLPDIEERFAFQASDEQWRTVRTVGELQDLVRTLTGQTPPGSPSRRTRMRQRARRGLIPVGLLLALLVVLAATRATVALLFLAGVLFLYMVPATIESAIQRTRSRHAWHQCRARRQRA